MKKNLTITAFAATALLIAPICFSDSTVNVVNDTNYSCYSNSADCTQSGSGAPIYNSNQSFQLLGDAVPVGSVAHPTIYKMQSFDQETVTVVAKDPNTGTLPASATSEKVVPNATFYAVMNPIMCGPMLISTDPKSELAK